MSDTTTIGFPEAARRLGVSLTVLRQAIRAKKIPAPAGLTATSHLSTTWLNEVLAAVKADHKMLSRGAPTHTPAFAHYDGTSAWRKFPRRVRDYNHHRAAQK
jgi:hypothetical protein